MAIVVQGPTPRTDALDATADKDVLWSRKGPEYRTLARILECELAARDKTIEMLRAMLGTKLDTAHAAGRAAIVAESQNVGHGHVFPRPDGVRARCGGPGLCAECSRDAARKAAEERGA